MRNSWNPSTCLKYSKMTPKPNLFQIWWPITDTVTSVTGIGAGVAMVTSTGVIGSRITISKRPRSTIEPNVRLYARPVPYSRPWALVQGTSKGCRRPMSKQWTLPSRCSVRIEPGSPMRVWVAPSTGGVKGGGIMFVFCWLFLFHPPLLLLPCS